MKTLLGISLALCTSCLGHNNLFFPGDAFFSSSLPESKNLQEEDSLSDDFYYKRLSGSFMLCGYLGYSTLKILEVPIVVRRNLGAVRKRMFSEFEEFLTTREEEDEATGEEAVVRSFPVLIYNRDYDFLKHPIGLRLNEDWVTIQVDEAKRGHAIYDGPENRGLVVLDWRLSSEVRGLDCKLDRKGLKRGMGSEESVVCEGKDIVFVVPVGNSVWDVTASEKGSRFFVVGETVREFIVTDKGLEESEQDATAPKMKTEGKEKPKPESEVRPQ